jgi:hypothetical protein
MSIRAKLLRKAIGKRVVKSGKKTIMTPAKKRALAKAVKASAKKRKTGAGISIQKTKLRLSGRTKPTKQPVAKKSLAKRKARAQKRAAKYDDKAQSTERNIQGSILNRDNKLNLARRIKLGHYARKSRRLDNKAKRIGNRMKRNT